MQSSTNMNDHILPKLAELAWGMLISQLKFVPRLNKWPNPLPGSNANEYRVPKISGGSAKDRLPGAPVIFEDRVAGYTPITAKQIYDAFVTDESYQSSTGFAYFESLVESAVKNVVQEVETYAAEQVALQGGIGTVGTLGQAVTRANLQTARLAFVNNKIPTGNLLAFLSGETMKDIADINEYTRFDAVGAVPRNALREGVADRVSGFELLESPYVYSPNVGEHTNLLFDPSQIMYIFPAQAPISGDAQKAEFERDGIRLYLLKEYLAGYNGAYAYTVSVNFGIKAVRPEGVIKLLGK
ncbi:MAG TPA: hypothetical protein PLY93_11730 [Turneriella sp.]|nr:hypothetical protein [Turneriella sp.]